MKKKHPDTVLDRLASAAVVGDIFKIRKILYDCRGGLSDPCISSALASSMTPDLETASNGLLSVIVCSDDEKPLNFSAIGHSTELISAISSYIKTTLGGDSCRLHGVVSTPNYEVFYAALKHIGELSGAPIARCDAHMMVAALSAQAPFDFNFFCKTIEGTGPAILVLEDTAAIVHERKVEQFWRAVKLLPDNLCVLYPFTSSVSRLAEAYPHLNIYNSSIANFRIDGLSKKDCMRLFEIRTYDFGGIVKELVDPKATYELYNCVISAQDLEAFIIQNDVALRPNSANGLFSRRIAHQIEIGYRICSLTKKYEDELILNLKNENLDK